MSTESLVEALQAEVEKWRKPLPSLGCTEAEANYYNGLETAYNSCADAVEELLAQTAD